MIIMMINYVDNNFDNSNDDNGDQTTMFLTMYFGEPLISEKPRFLVVTLGWVYNY